MAAPVILGLAVGMGVMSMRKQHTPHSKAVEAPPHPLEDVYVHHGTTEGIPQSTRFQRQTPSMLNSELGRQQELLRRQSTTKQVQHLLDYNEKNNKTMLNLFTPKVEQLPQPNYEGHIMKAIKAGTLTQKSQGDIALEMWRSGHRDNPMMNKLLCK